MFFIVGGNPFHRDKKEQDLSTWEKSHVHLMRYLFAFARYVGLDTRRVTPSVAPRTKTHTTTNPHNPLTSNPPTHRVP